MKLRSAVGGSGRSENESGSIGPAFWDFERRYENPPKASCKNPDSTYNTTNGGDLPFGRVRWRKAETCVRKFEVRTFHVDRLKEQEFEHGNCFVAIEIILCLIIV